jgi:hypothetical protein
MMNLIEMIDQEISRLQSAKALLAGNDAVRSNPSVRPVAKRRKKRTLSPEAKARISAAQKKRWAASKTSKK